MHTRRCLQLLKSAVQADFDSKKIAPELVGPITDAKFDTHVLIAQQLTMFFFV